MRIIHMSDLHIGKKVHSMSMLEEQRKMLLENIINIVKEKKADAVFIAGDVYDTQIPPASAVELFDEFITELVKSSVLVYIVPGNHDSAERVSFASKILNNSGIYICTPVNRDDQNQKIELHVCTDDYGKINIYMLPFLPVKRVNQMINNTQVDDSQRNILIAHQFVTSSVKEVELCDSETHNVGGAENIDASVFAEFDYVALGHLHAPQGVSRDTIRYAGSILKYSFSEALQNKSVTLIEFKEKGNIEIEKIPLIPSKDMRKIRGPLNSLISEDVLSQANKEDYLQVTLTDEEEVFDAFRKVKEVYPNVLKIDFDNSRTRATNALTNIENIEKKNELDLFYEFYENRMGDKIDNELKKIVFEIFSDID